jgi:sugar O-acyltransferase (sialic acid O-acetyltransferase NeuD family)
MSPTIDPLAPPQKVVVIGASGHAKVVLDILRKQRIYDVVGLLDQHKPVGFHCQGHVVLGGRTELPRLVDENEGLGVIVAIGDNWVRARIVDEVLRLCPDPAFIQAIHPNAQIAFGVVIGKGTVVMPGAVINAGASVGEFCILNTRCSLDHDSTMASFSSLSPAATTGGNVTIGAHSNIGMAATILQGISVGRHTVIGAGAVVFRAVPDEVVAYGVPARIIRARRPGDRYLGEVPNGF